MTGNELHGIEVSINEFVNGIAPHHPVWKYSDGYGQAYSVEDVDLQLKPASKAVDAGVILLNINDNFAGKAPDMGCYELNQELPAYGPRPPLHGVSWDSHHDDTPNQIEILK